MVAALKKRDFQKMGNPIGKLNIVEFASFVALERAIAEQALAKLSQGKIKGKQFKMRLIG
nr:DbpA RNA binding domain-containing protein [Chromobacterium violaceum]